MFSASTPSTSTSSKREQNFHPHSTPLNQVYPQDNPNQPNIFGSQVTINATPGVLNSNTAAPPSTAARTYKTRERLYYETDYVKSKNSPINPSNNANTNSPNLFEPFLRKQSTANTLTTAADDSEELPPTASLHEYLLNSGTSASNSVSSAQGPASHFSNLCSGSPMVINGIIGSPMKSNNNTISNMENSMFLNGESQKITRSITVFGFPPNCRNEVLLSFQSHGSIESFDAASDEGSNWIHIVYESEWAAQKALNRNGTIFQPTGVMIGVIPMQTALEKVNLAADSFMSPLKKTSFSQHEGEIPSIFLKKESSTSNTNSINIESLPSDSSLVTRAVNYIFGW